MKIKLDKVSRVSLNNIPGKEKKIKEKKQRIPLSKYTRGGKLSTIIAVECFLLIGIAVAVSVLMKGQAGMYVGAMMVLALISAFIGFGIGVKSFEEKGLFLKYSYIGTIANTVVWMGMLCIYLIFI